MNIKKLVTIANRAKTIGGGQNYSLANTIFAVICDFHLKNSYSAILKRKAEKITIEIETQDWSGDWMQTYYDVCTIRRRVKGREEQSLCIPIPLLGTMTCVALMKRGAESVPMRDHNREFSEPNEAESDLLWEQFLGIVSEYYDNNEVVECVQKHLSLDGADLEKIMQRLK